MLKRIRKYLPMMIYYFKKTYFFEYLEEYEKSYFNEFNKHFKNDKVYHFRVDMVNKTNSIFQFVEISMVELTSRLKRLIVTSSIPFALTNISSIQKIGYNFLKTRTDRTYFSSGVFRADELELNIQ